MPDPASAPRKSGHFWVRTPRERRPCVFSELRRVGQEVWIPRGEAEYQRRYESLPLPLERTGEPGRSPAANGWISLLNVAPESQEVLVEVLNAASGAGVASSTVRADPFEVLRVPLSRFIPPTGKGSEPVRLRIQGEARGLSVLGARLLGDGSMADIAFFGAYHGHGSGIFPLPDTARFDVVTPLLNLGEESSKIVAQVYWDGGTFALGPVTIPAGSSQEIDLDALALAAPRDIIGRLLEVERPRGVLQWTVMSGSTQLLGRTVVRPRAGQDRFGFNCMGCCPQQPSGAVVPTSVEFFPGETPSFEVAVIYDTCTGTIGPYSTGFSSLTTPSPFSWNGYSVGATDAAQEGLSFEGSELKISVTCNESMVNTWGVGMASTCKHLLRKAHNPSQSWNVNQKCVDQVGGEPSSAKCDRCQDCCNQIFAWRQCTKIGLMTASADHQFCLGECLELVCN